ncbi:MAG: AAA family ATPase [Clostridia bacterium]|nr:AAA family ATPase [Clostridia bacterium]
MARKIVVTSGKGGAGKTTVCALLGESLSRLNKRVIILDLDFSLNNLDVVTGVEDKVVYDVADVVNGRCRVKQAIIKVDRNLSVMQSGRSWSDFLSGQSIRLLTEGLNGYDFVFLDCPAGVDEGFMRAVSAADEAIVVVNPSPSSLRDADKTVNILAQYKPENVYGIVNKVRGDLVLRGKELSASEVGDILKIPIIGCVPDDDAVLTASSCDVYGKAMRSFGMIAKYLIKGEGKIYDCLGEFKRPFGRLKMALRSRG